ncbi:MAG: 1-deoxy-D-xylulose-5-phosphate synthase [Deltaproteobacteria bacterium]|nr:1-deoxy-D-xylulose-5-phosphate synthase [Deltaproteobacteria bacterium]
MLADISAPEDLKVLSLAQLKELAAELREAMIKVVTQNGGHLASSLGAVELIVALHFVFDAPRDQIVFDVGHQCYAHKLLTGRFAAFGSLRQAGGLSGFPRREESPYDAFGAGHASTSISAALGLAGARDLLGPDRQVVAVIGDGALTGGMAMEALNHAGGLQKNLLVVYNDNRMSISHNVGALSQYLSLKMTTPEHLHLRERVKKILEKVMPSKGDRLIRRFQRAEEGLKAFMVSPTAFLAAWGFKYLGPIDGHDLGRLIEAFKQVKNLKRPVLLHVVTTKGKGYQPAEDNPQAFHGVGRSKLTPHAPSGAEPVALAPSGAAPAKTTYTDVFGAFMVRAARDDVRLAAVTAAMSQGTGLDNFFALFPERAFDVGIAEQHAVTFAAGLAAGGLRPVAAIYSTFLQRSFDQLFHDVALQNLPVLLAVDRAGLVGEDGPTHHGGLDLSYLRLLPNFAVMAPRDEHELTAMLKFALTLDGPAAIRYPRGPITGRRPLPGTPLELGRAERLRAGGDLTLAAIGQTVWPAVEAADRLAALGHAVEVLNMRFVKPLDAAALERSARETGKIITVEENLVAGGLHGAAAEALAPLGLPTILKGLGLDDQPVPQASQRQQRAWRKLDVDGLVQAALELLAARRPPAAEPPFDAQAQTKVSALAPTQTRNASPALNADPTA